MRKRENEGVDLKMKGVLQTVDRWERNLDFNSFNRD